MKRVEILLVALLILIFTFLNNINYIAGVRATPEGSVYLGTVHWSGDFYYYLSQFAQGSESWFQGYDLYTGDFKEKTMVGWVNVFIGKLFYLVGSDHRVAYQAAVNIFTVTFLVTAYLVICQVFPTSSHPESRQIGKGSNTAASPYSLLRQILRRATLAQDDNARKRIVAFVFFLTANSFPIVSFANGQWTFSYYDYWYNNGVSFNRLGSVPHHLIARTMICFALYLSLRWVQGVKTQKGKIFTLLGLLLSGLLIASTEPVHWSVTVGAIGIGIGSLSFLRYLGRLGQKENIDITGVLMGSIPAGLIFLGGFPIAMYLKRLFTSLPYSQLATWEFTQSLHLSLLDFIRGNGPVFVLAIVGFFLWGRSLTSLTYPKVLMMVFPVLCIFVFFSPIPGLAHIVNVRFLPAALTLCFAVMAVDGLFYLSSVVSRRLLVHRSPVTDYRFVSVVTAVLVCILLMLMTPAFVIQIQNRIKTEPNNSFIYIPQKAYDAYTISQQVSSPLDTFIVMWPFNWSFPGIVGRRVYAGHPLLTIDNDKKETGMFQLIDGKMSAAEAKVWLNRQGIAYLLLYSWNTVPNSIPGIKKMYDNGFLALWKISS